MCLRLNPENTEWVFLVEKILKIVENKFIRNLNSIFAKCYCLRNVFVETYHLLIHMFTWVIVSSDEEPHKYFIKEDSAACMALQIV